MRFITVAVLALAASAAAPAKRGITAEDYFAVESISDAHISPDGKQVAYVLTTVDQKKNARNASIWAVAIDGRSAARRLTAEGVSSNSPRLSPDGSRMAFPHNRNSPVMPNSDIEPTKPQVC